MVSNIDKMIESVLEREDLMKELSEQETYDDVYDFCSDVQGGYTRDELFEFIDSSHGEYDMDTVNLDEELFNHVGGGKSVGNRVLSAMKVYKGMKAGPAIFKPQGNNDIF